MKNVVYPLALLLVSATVLPLWRTSAWWVRMLDFPRAQIAVAGALLLAVWGLVSWSDPLAGRLLFGGLALSVVYQAARILPYTPVFPKQVKRTRVDAPGASLSILVANVLMTNREAGPLLELVEASDPDVVLAVETDAWWAGKLAVLAADYPYLVARPLENTYGMILYSRLELIDAQVRFLIEDDIPSIHARVKLRCGEEVRLHCLHPKPPYPLEAEETTERDGELLIVGRELGKLDVPAVVLGDLNDVAWSSTTRLLRKVSGLLDPRIGRGLYSTFHARIPLLRWPLDHVFLSHHFQLTRLRRLPAFGSDHFPIFAHLSLTPWAPGVQEEPTADAGDVARAREMIRDAEPARMEIFS